MASIVESQAPLPGLMQIDCRGTSRFRILDSEQLKHGLWMAQVEPVADDQVVPVPDELRNTADALEKLLAALQEEGIAAHSGDHAIYPDCREPFMQGMATAMEEGTYARIKLMRPFIAMDKTAIAKRGVELGIDFAETWSCYKGGEIHCGTCGTCVERREAFILAGLPDPTTYLATPEIPSAPE